MIINATWYDGRRKEARLKQADRRGTETWLSASPPYRSMGLATVEEYRSRAERYDTQFRDLSLGAPEELTTEEKMARLRAYRENQYYLLLGAAYKRRGWDMNSIPTTEKLKELGMDLDEEVAVVVRARN